MSFAKTEKGRDALRHRASDMSRVERQILIVANGNRDAADLAAIMCRPVDDEIDRLIALGYLARTNGCAHTDFSPTGTLLDVTNRPAAPASPAAPARPTAQRSMAGAKMYLMSVLSLQRSMEAVEMSMDIHAATSHDEFLTHAARCLGVLAHSNGTTYVRRVARKLGRSIPDAHIPAFIERLRAHTQPEVVGAFIDEASLTVPGERFQHLADAASA